MEQAIVVLAVVGFLLLAAEVFVPGMVLGALGGLCLLTCVALCYAAFGSLVGTIAFAALCILTGGGLVAWLYLFPRTPMGRRVTLSRSLVPNSSSPAEQVAIGSGGQAVTALRPAGTAVIDGRRVDVVAETGFIEPGEPVTVVLVDGLRVVVRKA